MIKNQNKKEEYFLIKPDDLDLKTKAMKGGLISISSRIILLGIQFIGIVVLARLLSPDDFGLIAMAQVFTNLFFVFQDVGLTDATIQASQLNHKIASTLFWINSGIGVLIALIVFILAPFAVMFFKRPQLLPILFAYATIFIFYGLSFQHQALLKRKLKFMQIGIIGVVSYFLATSTAILMAIFGIKYWALVFRDIIAAISYMILSWFFCSWRPGCPEKSEEVKKLVKFGANSVGFYIINYFSNNFDKTIIGKKFGSEPLGFYSRAYYIAATPAGQLSQSLFHVAISTLSKLREDKEKLKKYYYNAISLISFIGMPFSAYIVVMNKELIYLLLGPKWNPTADLFAILGLSAGLNIIYQTNGWLHVSLGRSDRWLKWGIFSSIILTIGMLIGMKFGIKGIAWAYTLTIILLTIPAILFAGKIINISLSLFIKSILKNTISAGISGLILYELKIRFFGNLNVISKTILSVALFIILYFTFIVILSKGTHELERYMAQIWSTFVKQKGK
ncbi:MAG: lipopolysaccharide biosynthesis protein [Methanothermobacter tenebrarum]